MEKSSEWKIILMEESEILGLVHTCEGEKSPYRGIMDFSNIKDYEKMISRCPKCGEMIPIAIKSKIKTAKILNKYEL